MTTFALSEVRPHTVMNQTAGFIRESLSSLLHRLICLQPIDKAPAFTYDKGIRKKR